MPTRRIRKPKPEPKDERDPPLVDPLDPQPDDCPEVPDEDEMFKGAANETIRPDSSVG